MSSSVANPTDQDLVLCVDLDGSLLSGDLLHESFLEVLRRKPLDLLRIPAWLATGKAHLKRQLAERSLIDVSALPYNQEVLAFLRQQHAQGRKIVLATAAEQSLARAVADHLGIFDEVISSDGQNNLKGPKKREILEQRFGKDGFVYIGNGPEDLHVWEVAAQSLVVNPSNQLERQVRALGKPVQILESPRPKSRLKPWLRMARVHQWAKNVLLFVPLVTSHRLLEWPLILDVCIAFLAFSMAASSIYIFNDLIDLPSDRLHHRKRNRPLAAGAIPIPKGILTAVALLASALALACMLPSLFLALLLLYMFTSLIYSFWLKRTTVLDVICLAGLYTLRILAGGAAIDNEISPWLMAFSMFFFLSLALVKRFTELLAANPASRDRIPGRGYSFQDLDIIRSMGLASGLLAVLVIGLYLQDLPYKELYRHPQRLWLVCPIVLYWLMRIWFLAQRGEMHHDPVVFALRDRNSIIAGVLCGLILIAATF